ncbi:MAG: hypothetical protein K2J95_01510 [Lachnospiraceae bacterium]|nr:hypothetical protein [Lachnospiraceae bacterium]
MMKKNVRCLIGMFMMVIMLCGFGGCTSNDKNRDAEQNVVEVGDYTIVAEDIIDQAEEANLSEERIEAENAASGEDLDVVVPNAADDNWYMKGNIYTDDKGNQLEVFFDDYGMIEFAVNGLSMYYTMVDNFQQENNWKVYTCDDGTMIGFYPGEPAHLEICDGNYAGIYEGGGDKVD